MSKEKLIQMGLTEEQAKKVMEAINQISEENKTLKKSVSERDKQLEDLKKSSGDSSELKKQIEALQATNEKQRKTHDAEMAQLKLDNAVDTALTAFGAKNIKAVKPFIDASKVKLDENGKLTGLDEQLKEIKKTEGYLFAEKQTASFKGFQPGAGSDVKPSASVDFSKMTYSEMTAYMAANPDVKIN